MAIPAKTMRSNYAIRLAIIAAATFMLVAGISLLA